MRFDHVKRGADYFGRNGCSLLGFGAGEVSSPLALPACPVGSLRWGRMVRLPLSGMAAGGGGVLAVLYNPIQPIAFGNLWPWVNGFTATLLLAVVMGDSKKSCAVWSQRIGRVVVCAVLYALAFGLLIVLASTCWALSARYFGERVMKDGFAEWNLFGARASYEHVVMAQIAGWILAGVSALVILPLLWKWCWWRPVVAIHRALVRKEGPRITK